LKAVLDELIKFDREGERLGINLVGVSGFSSPPSYSVNEAGLAGIGCGRLRRRDGICYSSCAGVVVHELAKAGVRGEVVR
jgi:hypothetical protein